MNTNTTRSPFADSWLLTPNPPLRPEDNGLGWSKGNALLWWAVVWQSALDVLTLPESEALDAAEFLKDTGAYLVYCLFAIPVEETRKELARLMKKSKSLKRLTRGYRL